MNILECEIVKDKLDAGVKSGINLSSGRYLKYDILAFSGNWLVVYDGKYNYMLFNTSCNEVLRYYKHGWLPSNNVHSGNKYVEFYSTFDNALNNLMRVVVSNGFNPTFLRDVFE